MRQYEFACQSYPDFCEIAFRMHGSKHACTEGVKALPLPFSADHPWLAPLAGWSDLPFRLLCREEGAAVCCTEMLSAKGLVYNGKSTKELIRTCPADQPLVVQLFGAEPPFLAEAVHILRDMGFTWFDCNMGCAVPKVTRTGAGAALCRDTDQALRVAEALIHAAESGHVGFKLRLGWDNLPSNGHDGHGETWQNLAPALANLGAGWITLHPRTAKQGFDGTAQWQALAELKQMLAIPVIASGDLFTAADGLRCLQQTKVDTIMYARGALRDPSIFKQHSMLLQGKILPQPNAASLFARIRRHAQLAQEYASTKPALLKMRTIIPRYIRNLPNARQMRLAILACQSWEEFALLLAEFEKKSAAEYTDIISEANLDGQNYA